MREVSAFWSSFYNGLLDLVYPRKCALCGELGPKAICETCFATFSRAVSLERRPIHGVSATFALFPYSERMAQAVTRLKYERATALAGPMAQFMRAGAEEFDLLVADLIVPVPIHWTRRFLRGFNQSELLCEAMPSKAVCPRALRRIRATRPQVGLDRAARLKNLNGAFRADPCVAGKTVLLVDDVLTTGHTAEECSRVLLEAHATDVKALFFAGDRPS
jgi:ComF family protein